VKVLKSHKSKVVLAVAIIGALVAWYSRRDAADSPPVARREAPGLPVPAPASSNADFDFYLLALTVHPAFCADGHAQKAECRTGRPRVLAIHGLWPEKLEPGAYPHDCPARTLDLDPALAQQLEDFMPGMASGLHEHEWRKHGGCSGLDDDDYFRAALDLARALDAALGAKLTTLTGRETSAAELREVADLFQPGIGATFTLQCRTLANAPVAQRNRPYLIEIRQCVDNDGPAGAPGTLLNCASVNRRDQGCGASLRIAENRAR
jgi:ribonuclease I